MTHRRQHPALLRVGKNDGWPRAAIRLGEGIAQFGKVVPAQVAEHLLQFRVTPLTQQRGHVLRITAHARQPFAQTFRRKPQQPLIRLIGQVIDALMQQLPLGQLKCHLQLLAVFCLDDVPVIRLEHLLPAAHADARDHAIQALPVDVHHPEHVLQVHQCRLRDGLPHRALVQFRIADEAHIPPVAAVLRAKMHPRVFLRHRRKIRRARAQSHRAGREMHAVRVLRPARVRLQAFEGA